MFSTRTTVDRLGKRLDPGFYSPDHLANELKLSEFRRQKLDSIRVPSVSISYGVIKAEMTESTTAMVRIQDFDDPFVNLEKAATIEPLHEIKFSRARCAVGDLLVAIGGYPGRLGIIERVPPRLEIININQHVVRVRPLGGLPEARFLAAFFMSRHGNMLLSREVSGSVQAGINVEDLRDVEIPRFSELAESLVAEKIHQAGALREKAWITEAMFRSRVGLKVPQVSQRARNSRVRSQDLDLDLNPGRFTPDRLEVRRALELNNGRRLDEVASIVTENTDTPPRSSRYLGLDGISSSSIDVTYQSLPEAEISGALRVLPRGAAISKLRPYLNKAVFIDGGHGPVVGSAELLCLQSDQVHPAYLYGVLKLDTTVRQLNPVASGATHPRIGPEDVLDLLVPWDTESEALGISLENAQQAYFGARGLIAAARHLVEALIEGTVTEADLIAAGKDADADRALLARLRDDGLDGAGTRLFPDIDSLCELIEQVERTEADS